MLSANSDSVIVMFGKNIIHVWLTKDKYYITHITGQHARNEESVDILVFVLLVSLLNQSYISLEIPQSL